MANSTEKIQTVEGTVISNKMDKTIVVSCSRRVKNMLGKYVSKTTKLHAHDDENQCQEGDSVQLVQTRPLSKTKTWKLHKIVSRSSAVKE
ncbi:MAG: 30S ribosomal protein S17 [Pseudomonadota bacterium]|nr:30S ribosomal protein S17 [Pseudomonadota bacterium]